MANAQQQGDQKPISPEFLPDRLDAPYIGSGIGQDYNIFNPETVAKLAMTGGVVAAMRGYNPVADVLFESTPKKRAYSIYRWIRKSEQLFPLLGIFRVSEISSRYVGPDKFNIDRRILLSDTRESKATKTYIENLLGINLSEFDLPGRGITFRRVAGKRTVSPWFETELVTKSGELRKWRVKAPLTISGAPMRIVESSAERYLRKSKNPTIKAFDYLFPEGELLSWEERLARARTGKHGLLRTILSDPRLGRFGELVYKTFELLDIGHDVHGVRPFLKGGPLINIANAFTPGEIATGIGPQVAHDLENVAHIGMIPMSAYEVMESPLATIASRARGILKSPTLDFMLKRSFGMLGHLPFGVGKVLGLSPRSLSTGWGAMGSFLLKRALPLYVGAKIVGRLADSLNAKEFFASTYQSVMMGYAELSNAIGLTQFKRDIEAKFPGMSSPLAPVGFMAAGAIAAGTLTFAEHFGRGVVQGVSSEEFAEWRTKMAMTRSRGRVKYAAAKAEERIGGFRRFVREIGQEVRVQAEVGRLAEMSVEETFTGFAKFLLHTTRGRLIGGAALGLLAGLPFGIAAFPAQFGAKYTPHELAQIYAGRMKLPVKKGRWWELSALPWEGSGTSYYKEHWSVLMQSDYFDKAVWGSDEEKYKYDWFWNPHKVLFGNEKWRYAKELRHYQDRPYPLTGKLFADVPLIGPLLSATIGEFLKPQKEMHVGEWKILPEHEHLMRSSWNYIPIAGGNEPVWELAAKGEYETPSVIAPTNPLSFKSIIGGELYRVGTEMPGFPGFLVTAYKGWLTGHEDVFATQPRIADASTMTSVERRYWDLNLGGLMGMTEMYRRLANPHHRRSIESYNPIRNTMPDWLPDQNYFVDFQHGDPYAKIPLGEARLPGAGYEAIHPEVAEQGYDEFHQFRILADIAPYSVNYKKAAMQIRRNLSKGMFTPAQREEIDRIFREVADVKRGMHFTPYIWTESKAGIKREKVTVSEIVAPGKFTIKERPGYIVSLQGINMSEDALRRIHSASDVEEARKLQMEMMGKLLHPGSHIEMMTSASAIRQHTEGSSKPVINAVVMSGDINVNQQMLKLKLGEKKEKDGMLMNYVSARAGDNIIGKAWEFVTHAPIPGIAKFTHNWSALEDYERYHIYGRAIRLWQKPISHIIMPPLRNLAHYLGWNGIPGDVQERRSISEYFDKVEWLKWFRLERAAEMEGEGVLASMYRSKKVRTLYGMNPYGNESALYSALPKVEREHFQSFVDAPTQKERNRILDIVPKGVARALVAKWEMKAVSKLSDKLAAIDSTSKIRGIDYYLTAREITQVMKRRAAEGMEYSDKLWEKYREDVRDSSISYADWLRLQKLTTYFKEHELPKKDWIGWYPGVEMEDVKLMFVNREGLDLHDFNLWPHREAQLARKPYMKGAYISAEERSNVHAAGQLSALLNVESLGAVVAEAGSRFRSTTTLSIDRSREVDGMIYYNSGELGRYEDVYASEGFSW